MPIDDHFENIFRKHLNPTGLPHTALPWKKAFPHPDVPAAKCMHGIIDQADKIVGLFPNETDRDLALYFCNVHAALLAIIRDFGARFEFAALAVTDPGTKGFLMDQSEQATIYADLFTNLGTPLPSGDTYRSYYERLTMVYKIVPPEPPAGIGYSDTFKIGIFDALVRELYPPSPPPGGNNVSRV